MKRFRWGLVAGGMSAVVTWVISHHVLLTVIVGVVVVVVVVALAVWSRPVLKAAGETVEDILEDLGS